MDWLDTKQVAKDLKISLKTVQRYCREAYIPCKAVLRGKKPVYLINATEYLRWKQKCFPGANKGLLGLNKFQSKTREPRKNEIMSLIPEWLQWIKTGQLTGKPIADRTLEIYGSYIYYYFKALPIKPILPVISLSNLRIVLGQYKPEQYSTKQKIYDSIMSFTKYLIEVNKCDQELRESFRKIRPKRIIPPKRTVFNEQQLKKFTDAINKSKFYHGYNKVLAITLIQFIAYTGLRAKEVADLKLERVDLDAGIVHVYLGKGNKNRKVGINSDLIELLTAYLKQRPEPECDSFFITQFGTPLTRKNLTQKITRLARMTGFDITTHGLRRTFASINSAKGRPLNHLRIALGHQDLSTTQSYIMTTENEVIEAMKEW